MRTQPLDHERPVEVGPPPVYDRACADALDAFGAEFPPVSLDNVVEARALVDQLLPRPTDETLGHGGRYEIQDRAAPGRDGAPDVSLIVCRPVAGNASVPVLYYVHGGGMIGGRPWLGLPETIELAEPVGAAVVAVEYRLAPETPHPGPVEDCYAGLLWIAEHADDLGFDAQQIVLVGASAGGGLAAAVALLARDRRGPAVAGQLLMSPMLDDRNDTPSAHQMASGRLWNRSANAVGWTALLGESSGGPDVSPYAAPARATDLSELPPTFVDVGSADTFRDEDVDYANRIWQSGGSAELHVWPGGYHGFETFAPEAPLSRAAVAARANWLRRLLAE